MPALVLALLPGSPKTTKITVCLRPTKPQASLVILAAQLMHRIDHGASVRRVNARMYTMSQVEYMTGTIAIGGEDFCH